MARILPFVKNRQKSVEEIEIFIPKYFKEALEYAKATNLNFMFVEGRFYELENNLSQLP